MTDEEKWKLLVDAANTVPSLLMTWDITVKIGGIQWAAAELTRLREAVEAAISRMKKDGFCPLCAEEYSATWDSCDHHESCALLAYGAALKGEG